MNLFYVLAFPAWLVIIITAAARLHDLGRDQWALRHHVRRIGLIGIGAVAAIMLATPWTSDHWLYAEPTWRSTMLAWSWALVWLTTEGMPPWWDYILGVHRDTTSWQALPWRRRLLAEWQALRASFRPRRRAEWRYTGPERRRAPHLRKAPEEVT